DRDPDQYDPTESVLRFEMRPLEVAVKGFPIHRLQLETDEYYFAVKGKMRPAILLAGGEIQWPQRESEKLFLLCLFLGCELPKQVSEDLAAYGELVIEEYNRVLNK
ncbi:MAG: hypothetical protein ACE5H0_15310, partial [Bacteroidota bacterium]